jgi:uncharacterized membrane protein (Fun14 family)
MTTDHNRIESQIAIVDRKLDAAIFERKSEINSVRAEAKLTTKELSMEIKEMKKDIEQVSKDVCGVKGDIRNLDAKLDAKFEELIHGLDEKYANKIVEKIVYGMVGVVLVSVLYLLLNQAGIRK